MTSALISYIRPKITIKNIKNLSMERGGPHRDTLSTFPVRSTRAFPGLEEGEVLQKGTLGV